MQIYVEFENLLQTEENLFTKKAALVKKRLQRGKTGEKPS
jgi:hypothetical protein